VSATNPDAAPGRHSGNRGWPYGAGTASAAAIAAARQRAEAVASGAGVRLGPIVSVRDQANFEFGAQARVAPGAPPAPPSPSMAAAIPIDLKPKPIETRAQVFVSYAIVP
jgi:uncharacterized protein YggE